MRGAFRLGADDSEEEIGRKLNTGLTNLGLGSAEDRALLLNLLGLKVPDGAFKGLDGALIGLRTRDLLHRLLQARCAASPTIMILEDVHWIDSASEDLVAKMVAGDAGRPLLVVSTRRPEYRPPWAGGERVTTLALEPLSATDTGRIVQQRFGIAAVPEALAKAVLDKADGNALFAEEMASHLLESGVVRRSGDQLDFDQAVIAQALPPSVQGLLAARVDALKPQDRAVLQAASVIGRSFDPDLLRQIVGGRDDVEQSLAAATALELVHVDAKTGDYVFKHALVRDALYDSLLSTPRATLHLKAADEIERRSGNRIAEVAELLAHHYGQTSDHAKAFAYCTMAGAKSLGVYSLDQAETYLRRAEALLDQTPDCATDDQFATFVTNALMVPQLNYEPKRIVEMSRKYRERIDSLGDRVESVIARHHETAGYTWMGDFNEARKRLEPLSAMAERLGDNTSRAYVAANAFMLDSPFCRASTDIRKRGDEAIAIASRTDDAYINGAVRFAVAWNAVHRGHIYRARAIAADLFRIGSDLGDPRLTGQGFWIQSWVSVVFDDGESALRYAEEGMAVAITVADRCGNELNKIVALAILRRMDELVPLLTARREEGSRHGRGYELMATDLPLGVATVLRGRFAAGVRDLEQKIAALMSEGIFSPADWYRMALVRVYLDVLDGKEKPPLGIILRNIGFIVKTMISGRAKAIKLAEHVTQNTIFNSDAESFHIGEANYLLGLCYRGAKKRDKAKAHFAAAREVVKLHGPSPMLDRIDAALAGYGHDR